MSYATSAIFGQDVNICNITLTGENLKSYISDCFFIFKCNKEVRGIKRKLIFKVFFAPRMSKAGTFYFINIIKIFYVEFFYTNHITLMSVKPRIAYFAVCTKENLHFAGIFHFLTHDFKRPLRLVFRRFNDKFVVHLKDEL